MSRRVWVVAVALLSFAVLLGVGIANERSDERDQAIKLSPTPTEQPEAAAAAVIQRFIDALDRKDVDALYALQEDAYKRVCDRTSFEAVAASLNTQPLEGPASVIVQGDIAGASLFEVQPDGAKERVLIPLVLQSDGWRLAAPSLSGCAP